jgi:hypothetical protein
MPYGIASKTGTGTWVLLHYQCRDGACFVKRAIKPRSNGSLGAAEEQRRENRRKAEREQAAGVFSDRAAGRTRYSEFSRVSSRGLIGTCVNLSVPIA